MKIILDLEGYQDKKYCSTTSSIQKCEKLNINTHRCRLFKKGLEYDWNNHAFKRCGECLKSEVKKEDIEVIKSALHAHIRQCKEFILLDNKVKAFTGEERKKLEEKISKMEQLLKED